MKSNKNMEWIYIILSVIGFTVWAFLQISFVKNSSNQGIDRNQLLFSIIVPLLASIIVCIVYRIRFGYFPVKNLLGLSSVNWIFIVVASVGLAVAYFAYVSAVFKDEDNAAIITAGNVIFLTSILFFICYKNDKFNFPCVCSVANGASIALVHSKSSIKRTLPSIC